MRYMSSDADKLDWIGQDIRGHCTDLHQLFGNKNEYKNPELAAVKIMEKIIGGLSDATKVVGKIRETFADVGGD